MSPQRVAHSSYHEVVSNYTFIIFVLRRKLTLSAVSPCHNYLTAVYLFCVLMKSSIIQNIQQNVALYRRCSLLVLQEQIRDNKQRNLMSRKKYLNHLSLTRLCSFVSQVLLKYVCTSIKVFVLPCSVHVQQMYAS